MTATLMVPFFDPSRAYAAQREELRAAAEDVLTAGRVMNGHQVAAFEEEFAKFCSAAHAVGVSSGTTALELGLRALELEPGSRVVCPNLTSPATGLAIVRAGHRPTLVDVDEASLTIDAAAAAEAARSGAAAVVAVHLYGRPAPVELLMQLGVPLLEDASHAQGLTLDSGRAGAVGTLGGFSLYPTKNLGAFGDAGALTTSDPVLAERARVLRTYGQGAGGTIDVVGASGRLDELQAAFLRVRLRRLDEDNRRRADIVARYDAAVGRSSPPGVHHVYVVRSSRRDELRAHFADAGIATAVHYARPLDEHGAFANAERIGGLATSRRAAREVLSLPCHPHLTSDEEALVASALERAAALVDVV